MANIPYIIGGKSSNTGPVVASVIAAPVPYTWDTTGPLASGNHTEFRVNGSLIYAVDFSGNVTVASIISDTIQSLPNDTLTLIADNAGSPTEGVGAITFKTTKTVAPADHMAVWDNNGTVVFEIHGDGHVSVPYSEDLTPGGSGSPVSTVWTWTPPTSISATLSAGGQVLTIPFNVSATQTVTDAKAAIAANPIFNALYSTSGTTTLVLTSNLPGVGGENFPVTTNGAHGSSILHSVTGTGANATLSTPSGRIVWSPSQEAYTVASVPVLNATSIIIPVVETVGLNLALGVIPFVGGFSLFNPVPGPQMTTSFQVLVSP